MSLALWQAGGEVISLHFCLQEKFFLSKNFLWKKYKIWDWKSLIFWELRGKFEILSTHNLLSELNSCLLESCNFLLLNRFNHNATGTCLHSSVVQRLVSVIQVVTGQIVSSSAWRPLNAICSQSKTTSREFPQITSGILLMARNPEHLHWRKCFVVYEQLALCYM